MPGLTHPCPSQEGIAASEISTVVPYLELKVYFTEGEAVVR